MLLINIFSCGTNKGCVLKYRCMRKNVRVLFNNIYLHHVCKVFLFTVQQKILSKFDIALVCMLACMSFKQMCSNS